MSQAPVGTSSLVRVTVTSGTRRVDLVLPGAVPVAELIPDTAVFLEHGETATLVADQPTELLHLGLPDLRGLAAQQPHAVAAE